MRPLARSVRVIATSAIIACACSQQSSEMAESNGPPSSEPVTVIAPTTSTGTLRVDELTDAYRAPALGMRFEKPSHWVYLPETNHPNPLEYSERLSSFELRRVIRNVFAPVVSIARPVETGSGLAPKVSFFFRFANEPGFLQLHYQAHPDAVARINIKRLMTRPNAAIVADAELTPVGGQPGAVIRLRYDEPDPDTGEMRPVEMRIWNTKRDDGYFYAEASLPEPVSPELEGELEQILASYQLAPPREPAISDAPAAGEDRPNAPIPEP